jgi:hypothetical protein
MGERSLQFAIAVIVILLAGFASQALACSCIEIGPPCQAYWNSSVVFIGTPLSVSQTEVESNGHKVPRRLYRFRVEEAFRGIEGVELEILTGVWGGDLRFSTANKILSLWLQAVRRSVGGDQHLHSNTAYF